MQSLKRYFGLTFRLSISFLTYYCCYHEFVFEHCIEILLFYFVLYSIYLVFCLFIWFLCKWVLSGSFVVSNCEFFLLSHWYPGSGVLLDCIVS